MSERPTKKVKTLHDAESEIATLKAELAAARTQLAPKPTLGELMRRPATCYGTCVLSTSPKWVSALASCPIDFVFIDTEHIPIPRDTLSWMCNAYRGVGLHTLVRIPEPDPYAATMALDGGASGIVAPYLETVEQVQALRGAVKLRPYKGKRLQEKLDDVAGASPDHEAEYCKRVNRSNALVLNIESQPAIDNLDEILKIPDIDALLIGPHDLSCNLGVPEQFDHPKFIAACRTIWRKARAAGVGAAIHQGKPPDTPGCTPADEINWLKNGCNVLVHGSDVTLFTTNLKNHLREIRAGVGEQEGAGKDSTPSQACM